MPLPVPVAALAELLDEMRRTIVGLDDATYAAPAPGRASGGIGGHVRHCLDHVSALLASTETGVCEYDRRHRGTNVETSRVAAVGRIAHLTAVLVLLAESSLDAPVLVESQLDQNGTMALTQSSVCRELIFVMSHTVHHNALIAQLLCARGVGVGHRYGVAPATPEEPAPCAR